MGAIRHAVPSASEQLQYRPPPVVIVVMGVSGSGKSTVGSLLAGRLQWEFEDGDGFHPAANIEKMRAGNPLKDEDRWPWLRAIARVDRWDPARWWPWRCRLLSSETALSRLDNR